MAFVVPVKNGRFEIRESKSTPKGPRSQTLASFRELDDEIIERVRARSTKPPDPGELRRAARRAGAPIAQPPVDRAARELAAELGRGRRLDPTLRHLLLDLLHDGPPTDRERTTENSASLEVSPWLASTPEERGRALLDLLLLTDALPPGRRRDDPLRFPRLDSSGG